MYIVLVRLVSASPFLPSYSAFFVSSVLLLLLHFLVPLPPVFLFFVFYFRYYLFYFSFGVVAYDLLPSFLVLLPIPVRLGKKTTFFAAGPGSDRVHSKQSANMSSEDDIETTHEETLTAALVSSTGEVLQVPLAFKRDHVAAGPILTGAMVATAS